MSVGYLADSFDLINVRDIDLIAQARARCSRLVVGVFTDEYAEQVFGRRPVVPLPERIAVLRHIQGVAEVVIHHDRSDDEVGAVVFAADDVLRDGTDRTIWLTPSRHTDSVALRNALATGEREAVA